MAARLFTAPMSGWGRHPVVSGQQLRSEDLKAISESANLSRGLGRSYGDASLPSSGNSKVADSTLADRLLSFDPTEGVLKAEAGFSLFELNRLFLPRGWFVPVSPGTQFVTLGGMVAADVHGKNHHIAGCFGEHVIRLRIRVPDGRVLETSDDQHSQLFHATLGGMGMTGHILEVEFRMQPTPTPWIWCESLRLPNLQSLISRLREAASSWPYTVGWLDCLASGMSMGRGILMQGRWATPSEAPRQAPPVKRRWNVSIEMPRWVVSHWSIRAFNTIYYWKHLSQRRAGIVHPLSFFYPLDSITNWNLMYGRRGFTQYQCVLPNDKDDGPVRRFMELVTALKVPSFLSVVKDCGEEGKGLISFPMKGMSIALDIPIRPKETQVIIDQLNERVISEGGRIYLAKDALTRPEHFRAMELRLDLWNKVRKQWDPNHSIRSAQSVRLFGDVM